MAEAAPLEIREARPGEAEPVLASYEWLFAPPGSEPPDWQPEAALGRLRETIESERSAVLVAIEGESIVGICSVCIDLRSVRFGDRCWVEDLAVDPERRSQGIGGRLLDAAEKWAAAHGASHLELDSGELRTDAHRFYESRDPAWRSKQYAWVLGR